MKAVTRQFHIIMESILDVDSGLADVCRRAQSVLAGFDGYFIERIFHDSGENGGLLIQLQERPQRPDVIVLLGGLRHLSIGDMHDLEGCFIDEIELTFIPSGRNEWPEGLTGVGPRHRGLPDLAWLRVTGPTRIEAVAATVQIYASLLPG